MYEILLLLIGTIAMSDENVSLKVRHVCQSLMMENKIRNNEELPTGLFSDGGVWQKAFGGLNTT